MRPAPGEVVHFSEDPTIGPERASDYWFPRQCPRAMAWVVPSTTDADRAWLAIGRVHAIEYGRLEEMRSVRLYVYRFSAGPVRPFGAHAHAVVATVPVERITRVMFHVEPATVAAG